MLDFIDPTDVLDFDSDDGVLEAAYMLVEAMAHDEPTVTAFALLRRRVYAKAEKIREGEKPSPEDIYERHIDNLVSAEKEANL